MLNSGLYPELNPEPNPELKQHLIVMGVAGCGKTTLGQLLAKSLSRPFYDGDDYHPADNLKKMANGEALTDAARLPWLKALNAKLQESDGPVVLACSALREQYRQTLGEHLSVIFVYLDVSRQVARDRATSREHFFPVSLIDAQFETLEVPTGSNVIRLSSELTPEQSCATILVKLHKTT
ncbi:MAG: gluconokinase [Candidatus Azotimanducaceae bacterium WSBS_2022_MAG_OTU7]